MLSRMKYFQTKKVKGNISQDSLETSQQLCHVTLLKWKFPVTKIVLYILIFYKAHARSHSWGRRTFCRRNLRMWSNFKLLLTPPRHDWEYLKLNIFYYVCSPQSATWLWMWKSETKSKLKVLAADVEQRKMVNLRVAFICCNEIPAGTCHQSCSRMFNDTFLHFKKSLLSMLLQSDYLIQRMGDDGLVTCLTWKYSPSRASKILNKI